MQEAYLYILLSSFNVIHFLMDTAQLYLAWKNEIYPNTSFKTFIYSRYRKIKENEISVSEKKDREKIIISKFILIINLLVHFYR